MDESSCLFPLDYCGITLSLFSIGTIHLAGFILNGKTYFNHLFSHIFKKRYKNSHKPIAIKFLSSDNVFL